MAQVTGRAYIKVNGKELRTLDGASFNPGGVNREAMKGGGKVHGFKEDDVEPTMKCKVVHTKDTSLKELADITDATVIFETDTGKRFVMREAWTSEPPELDANGGSIDLSMAAIAYDED
ncbi:MAG: phage tail tube protein [Candidatus Sedimenticola sp. (ex Thyasira tokunagai)]